MPMAFDQNLVVFIDKKRNCFQIKKKLRMSIFDITNGFIQTIKSSYNVKSVSYKFLVNTKVTHY